VKKKGKRVVFLKGRRGKYFRLRKVGGEEGKVRGRTSCMSVHRARGEGAEFDSSDMEQKKGKARQETPRRLPIVSAGKRGGLAAFILLWWWAGKD